VADPTADDFPPDTPARAAAELLLRRQLEVMRAREAGLHSDLDPEFLHDFRVAIRRTRSLLSLGREILGRKSARRFRSRFGRLGRQSGRQRDLDVQLAELSALAAVVPEAERLALRPVEAWLRRRRSLAHFNLRRLLAGSGYRLLLREWADFLDVLRAAPGNDTQPASVLAREAVRGAWRRVCREGRAIGDHSPPAELHELRKSAKRLRYAVEFFRPLLRKDDARAFIRDLKQLQDHLGAFQDCRVQLDTLQHAETDLLGKDRLSPQTALAVARLRAALLQREGDLRRQFREHFGRFPCTRIARRLQAMFRDAASAAPDS
jgi:CHAD domain-containing protein